MTRSGSLLAGLAVVAALCGCDNGVDEVALEKGDAVYRDLDFPLLGWVEHSALYRDWKQPEASSPDAVPMEQQRIIEMHEDGIHADVTIASVAADATLRGVGTMPALTAAQRRVIVATALSMVDAEADYVSWLDFFGTGYKNPDGQPPTFRCDGLVEYCYEVALGDPWTMGANGGIVENDVPGAQGAQMPGDQTILTPRVQREALAVRSSGEPPVLTLRDSSGFEIPAGGTLAGSTLTVEATDGSGGSGLARLEVWQGQPGEGGIELTSQRRTSFPVDDGTPSTQTLSGLPSGHLWVRLYDQAGNCASTHFHVAGG